MRIRHVLQQTRRRLAGAVACPAPPKAPQRLGVEVLEDRAVPAVLDGNPGDDTILVEVEVDPTGITWTRVDVTNDPAPRS